MATISNPNFMQIVGYPENIVVASKSAQNEYLLFPQDPMVLIENAYLDEGAETFVHAAITVASFTLTDTQITYSAGSGIPRLKGDYILKVEKELIHIKADTNETADTGTLTVVRGAFGTAAASHPASVGYTAYIQNSIKLTGSLTGDVKILYKGVPLYRDGLNMSSQAKTIMSDTNPNKIYGSDYPTS
jgi:hypothetical protein